MLTALHGAISMVTLDPVRVYLGTLRPMEMQVRVRVLSDTDGPLLEEAFAPTGDPPEPAIRLRDDHWAELGAAIDEARRIFKAELNVVLKPEANSEMIEAIRSAAPEYVLHVGCNRRAYREGLSDAGRYFEAHKQMRIPRGRNGQGAPITVFIVKDVQGKSGCSLGPLTDYVTVDVGGLVDREGRLGHPPWTLAHELGHACNLWHHGDTLMRPGPVGRRDYLKRWQKVLFRASGHVVRS